MKKAPKPVKLRCFFDAEYVLQNFDRTDFDRPAVYSVQSALVSRQRVADVIDGEQVGTGVYRRTVRHRQMVQRGAAVVSERQQQRVGDVELIAGLRARDKGVAS